MKYFTREWWAGHASDAPGEAYWSYIESVLPKLPESLARLLDDAPLHDSNISSFALMQQEQSAVLELDGSSDPWFAKQVPQRARHFILRYEQVESVTIEDRNGSPVFALDGSDLGYDEIELLSDGKFQHRMLFASGTELHITFRGFRIEFRDDDDRPARLCPFTADVGDPPPSRGQSTVRS